MIAAIETVHTSPWGSDEYGNARAFIAQILEKDLREWSKTNPPGSADYTKDTPRRAVYLYYDQLSPEYTTYNVVNDILFSGNYYEKVVAKVIQSIKSSAGKGEKAIVASRYPEYLNLLKEIREAKRQWTTEDALIKQSESFRVMGGLARLGSRSGSRYAALVRRVQDMEKSSLGKILTKHTKAN
jgi:hypothetical protein